MSGATPAGCAQAATPGQADFINPAELDTVEDLRQALQQANVLLLQERVRLQACMRATDGMVATLGRLVTAYLAHDGEKVAGILADFIKGHVVVVGTGDTAAGEGRPH